MSKRIFKLKTFARWARRIISDEALCHAAAEIMIGRYEADLGKGLCKKRVAVPGQGKSGSVRTLVAKESAHGVFFIAGRQKSDPGTDFSDANVAQAQLIGQALQAVNSEKLDELVADGVLKEIRCDHQKD